ncbi:MAG: hypothetical protein KAS01_00225 [Candidatus Pacebacteria bacterium]|nr:hypothetical protein [Candidatus Paceibacterota bacterium]
MTFNVEENINYKEYLSFEYVKNFLSLFLLILFVLIACKAKQGIDNIEICSDQIPNYDSLILDPSKRVEEFKKGSIVIDIIKRKEFIELRNEDNLIKEGKKVKEGNLFLKKF